MEASCVSCLNLVKRITSYHHLLPYRVVRDTSTRRSAVDRELVDIVLFWTADWPNSYESNHWKTEHVNISVDMLQNVTKNNQTLNIHISLDV
jgi:hypothetical protein